MEVEPEQPLLDPVRPDPVLQVEERLVTQPARGSMMRMTPDPLDGEQPPVTGR